MVPVGQGVRHEYQDMFRSFTCCVGSGMESHSLHGDGIYYESGDRLWINLFVPSTANWEAAGVKVAMETDFPEGESVTLKLTVQKPKQFTLALRRPAWATDGFTVKVNGKAISNLSQPDTYVELKRVWKTGDTVSLVLPKTLRLEALPDNKNIAALMWGPLVLAGDLGPERRGAPVDPVPSFVAADHPLTDWLRPVAGKPDTFRSEGVGRTPGGEAKETEFVPFYRLHRRTYSLYWDLYTQDGWNKKLELVAAEQQRQRKLEAATVGFAQPGDAQKEKDFNQQGEQTTTDRVQGRTGRRGKKWFSYDLPLEQNKPLALLLTYFSDERGKRTFEVLIDGQRMGEQTIDRSPPGSAAGHFFDVEYKLPMEVLKDKKTVTVRFQATNGNEIAGVYGVRLIRADADR
jgi:hypothetical protein